MDSHLLHVSLPCGLETLFLNPWAGLLQYLTFPPPPAFMLAFWNSESSLFVLVIPRFHCHECREQ